MAFGICNKFGHALTLLDSLSEMRDERSICDFTITIGEVAFKAHRAVLVACSDYFKAMITSDMKESEEGCANLKDVEVDAFKLFLDYIYTGEAAVTIENCCRVLMATDFLQCSDLKAQCVEFLGENINVEICLQVKTVAEMLSLNSLASHAEQYSVENFDRLRETDHFQTLAFVDLIDLMKKSREENEILWKAIISWTLSEEGRETYLPDLLNILNLKDCTFEFLFEIVWADVQQSEPCKRVTAEAIFSVVQIEDFTKINCFELLRLAHQYGEEDRCNRLNDIRYFIAYHIGAVGQNPQFASLQGDDVVAIYDNLPSWSSKNWMFLVKWVKVQTKFRKKYFVSILEKVARMYGRFDFVYHTMLGEEFVKSSEKLTALVTSMLLKVMKYHDITFINWFHLLELAHAQVCCEPPSDVCMEHILDFINNNFDRVTKDENFLKIGTENFMRVLQRMHYILRPSATENEIPQWTPQKGTWKAVSAWIQYEARTRLPYLKNVLITLNLKVLPFRFLFKEILRDPIIKKSPGCESLVITAVISTLRNKDLTPENCFEIVNLVRPLRMPCAIRAFDDVRKYMACNFEMISESTGLTSLTSDELMHILQSPDLKCGEETKWNASLRWLKNDPDNRNKLLPQILKKIDLQSLSNDFLQYNIFVEDHIKRSDECKTMIIEALFHKITSLQSPAVPQTRLDFNNPSLSQDILSLYDTRPIPTSRQLSDVRDKFHTEKQVRMTAPTQLFQSGQAFIPQLSFSSSISRPIGHKNISKSDAPGNFSFYKMPGTSGPQPVLLEIKPRNELSAASQQAMAIRFGLRTRNAASNSPSHLTGPATTQQKTVYSSGKQPFGFGMNVRTESSGTPSCFTSPGTPRPTMAPRSGSQLFGSGMNVISEASGNPSCFTSPGTPRQTMAPRSGNQLSWSGMNVRTEASGTPSCFTSPGPPQLTTVSRSGNQPFQFGVNKNIRTEASGTPSCFTLPGPPQLTTASRSGDQPFGVGTNFITQASGTPSCFSSSGPPQLMTASRSGDQPFQFGINPRTEPSDISQYPQDYL